MGTVITNPAFKILNLVVLIVICQLQCASSTSLPNITFYTGTQCTGGLQETFYQRYDSSAAQSSIVPSAKSAQMLGLWWFIVEDTRDDSGKFGWVFVDTHNDEYASLCNYGTPWAANPSADYYRYLVVYRIGPADLHSSAITFYTEHNFRGTLTQVDEDGEVSWDYLVNVGSLVFSGNESWTLYTGMDYGGQAIAISPWTTTGQEASLHYLNVINDLEIGSVRRGVDNRTGEVARLEDMGIVQSRYFNKKMTMTSWSSDSDSDSKKIEQLVLTNRIQQALFFVIMLLIIATILYVIRSNRTTRNNNSNVSVNGNWQDDVENLYTWRLFKDPRNIIGNEKLITNENI